MVWVKKTTGRSPGYHAHSREDLKHAGWCLNKNIKIAVIPSGTEWQVEITIDKSVNLDSSIYRADEAYKKMYEYYKYYYDKHNK